MQGFREKMCSKFSSIIHHNSPPVSLQTERFVVKARFHQMNMMKSI
jgi:hypothetical protein